MTSNSTIFGSLLNHHGISQISIMPLGIMGLGELSWAMPSTNFPTSPYSHQGRYPILTRRGWHTPISQLSKDDIALFPGPPSLGPGNEAEDMVLHNSVRPLLWKIVWTIKTENSY